MFLLFYEDVASERELMATLPEQMDWLRDDFFFPEPSFSS